MMTSFLTGDGVDTVNQQRLHPIQDPNPTPSYNMTFALMLEKAGHVAFTSELPKTFWYTYGIFCYRFTEVNKNNLQGGQFLLFAQKSRKIINWVGSLYNFEHLT